MAITPLQRRVCRVLSDRHLAAGERYVAGGSALNAIALEVVWRIDSEASE